MKTAKTGKASVCIIRNDTIAGTPAAVRAVSAAAAKLGIRLLPESAAARADLLLVLGGDGSMLRAVGRHASLEKPFMGVNVGTLGYLSATDLPGAEEALRDWLEGSSRVEERSMLRAQIRRGGNGRAGTPALALNDLVATREGTGRVACLELDVDGESVAEFPCDGLVLATPTGSTAYSLSAGGPVVSPRADSFVVNVICPHTLSFRPIVLPSCSVATVRVARAEESLAFFADGSVRGRLRRGDSFTATTAALKVRIVEKPGSDPFATLRAKLGWNFSSAADPAPTRA